MTGVGKSSQPPVHRWDLKPDDAMALQVRLSDRVVQRSSIKIGNIMTVAGVDSAYNKGMAYAAVVLMDLSEMKILENAVAARPVGFPYIPGLFAFREGPAILKALGRLKSAPDLLMLDGQGIAHPRRFGIASHIGLLTAIPAVGCAKTRLLGDYEEPLQIRGSISELKDGEETIGAVVRTRTGVKPVFVSVGHLMSLGDCIRMVLQSCRGCRLPEPIRRADQLSRKETKSV